LLKHLQSLPALQSDETKDLSLQDRSQRVLDAIHEFGKGENRYLMSVGDTKGKQVEQIIKDKKPKVSHARYGWVIEQHSERGREKSGIEGVTGRVS
jgi:hypothetical protein